MSTDPPTPDVPPQPVTEAPGVAVPEAVAGPGAKPAVDHELVVPSTRTSSTWTGIGIGLFALLAVIIFIGQNTKDATIYFLSLRGSFPIGLAVLLGFVLGGIVVLLLGVARLAQLRLMARRHRRRGRR